jgi:hypothetical protein
MYDVRTHQGLSRSSGSFKFLNGLSILFHFNITIFAPFALAVVAVVIIIIEIDGWLNPLGVKLIY